MWLTSVHGVVYFYKVCRPTPWTFGNIPRENFTLAHPCLGYRELLHVLLLRVFYLKKIDRYFIESVWRLIENTDVCSALQLSHPGSLIAIMVLLSCILLIFHAIITEPFPMPLLSHWLWSINYLYKLEIIYLVSAAKFWYNPSSKYVEEKRSR